MAEFNHQWEKIPSPAILYNSDRIAELLMMTKMREKYFKDKKCLDVGCGNGRYTYAMLKLGADVTSFDISENAVNSCKRINPKAYIYDIKELQPNPIYDFVLCWGVLHHLSNPREGFKKASSQVRTNGILHIMVYHKNTQNVYTEGRNIWHKLNEVKRLSYCKKMINKHGGNLHGWWDALNPQHNWSYFPKDIRNWFREEGFKNIKLTQKYNINMNGVKI